MDDECNEYTSSEEQVRYARELKPNHYDSGVVKMIAPNDAQQYHDDDIGAMAAIRLWPCSLILTAQA